MFEISIAIWLLNIGSVFLGLTLAFVILCLLGGRDERMSGSETCLISVLCIVGSNNPGHSDSIHGPL